MSPGCIALSAPSGRRIGLAAPAGGSHQTLAGRLSIGDFGTLTETEFRGGGNGRLETSAAECLKLQQNSRDPANASAPMTELRVATADPHLAKGSWSEIFRDGLGLYTALVIGGIAMHATQMLVIAIIMPTIVADIGGATYYTWAAMLYTIGAIVGASSTGVIWGRIGPRRGYALGAAVFALGTIACALAPNIGALIAARAVQGWAGGLVAGSGMALITGLFDARLRTRIIAMSQGTFTACHLSGPVVGGLFAAVNWWRGSFWIMVPFMLGFAVLAWWRIPDRLPGETGRNRAASLPVLRLATLTAGVFCVAAAGPVREMPLRIGLIAAAVALVALTFRLDREASNNLFPPRAVSLNASIGLALWILTLHGMTQTSVSLFLPLLLQVAHGVSPVYINVLNIVISTGWTIATFSVSGWSGLRERIALASGPTIALGGLVALTLIALLPGLVPMMLCAFVMGIGIGVYNVHLVARAMDTAGAGEQRSTAAALTSVRSIGTAFGAAIAGVVATTAGLGEATEPQAVGQAVTAVLVFCWLPYGLAALFMLRFLRIALPRPATALAAE
jgi:MFS family permease